VWYVPGVLRRVVAILVIAGLAAGGGWASARASRGSALAARGGVRLVSIAGAQMSGRWQAWANDSLVPTVTGRVAVRLVGCPALPKASGCVYSSNPRTIYLRRGLRNPRGVLLHELGHVYDLTVLGEADRRAFLRIMGLPASRSWWKGQTPPAEWFAEGYSWCARYARIVSIKRYAIYHYNPTPRQHQRLCALIKRAAHDNRPPASPKAPPVVTGPDPAPPTPPAQTPGTVPGAAFSGSASPASTPSATPPAATPTPSRTPRPTATPTPTPTPHGTPKPTPTPKPTATPTPTPTPSPTAEPSPDPTDTPTPEPTATPPDPTPIPTAEPEPTPTPRVR
jgi:hypothetical protein